MVSKESTTQNRQESLCLAGPSAGQGFTEADKGDEGGSAGWSERKRRAPRVSAEGQ